jgi:hypothetical protein
MAAILKGWARVCVAALALFAVQASPLEATNNALPGLSVLAPSLELSQHVRDIFRQAAPRLAQLTGGQPDRIKVEVTPNRLSFNRRAKELGGPEWAAGMAIPRRGFILLRSPKQFTQPGEFKSVLIHELTHLYLARQLKGRPAPLWLEEGMAMYAASEGGLALASVMTRGVLSEKVKPFEDLAHRFPSGADEAALAYAQSYYMVSYILNSFGHQALPKILRELAMDRDLTAALFNVTGQSLVQVEAGYRDSMTSRFSWMALLFAGSTLWALVAVVAGVSLVWRRKKHKQALKQMEIDESLEKEEMIDKRIWPPPPVRGDVLGQAGLVRPGLPSPSPPEVRERAPEEDAD